MAKMWAGRTDGTTDKIADDFNSSIRFDSRMYRQDITGSMVKAMYWFFPCLAVPFGYAVFTAYYARASLQREIALVKQAIAAGAEAPAAQKQQKDHSKLLSGLRWALLGLAIAIAVYGFFAGGTNDVLTKAINICTECVGLG